MSSLGQLMLRGPVAANGEYVAFDSAGQGWAVTRCRTGSVPDGQPHVANAWCVTGYGEVVLISRDGER